MPPNLATFDSNLGYFSKFGKLTAFFLSQKLSLEIEYVQTCSSLAYECEGKRRGRRKPVNAVSPKTKHEIKQFKRRTPRGEAARDEKLLENLNCDRN